MISKWDVLRYVAQRYGKVETVFDKAHEKLEMVRENKIPLSSLEDNMERMQMRMAREEGPPRVAAERINGLANFQDVWILGRLAEMSRSVCRILKRGQALGTGFLIADNVIITNHHVIGSADDASDMSAEFGYEYSADATLKQATRFQLNAATFFLTSSLARDVDVPNSGLDFTLIGIDTTGENGAKLADTPSLRLDGNKGKIIKGESCIIIQHPSGLPKKVVISDTAFFSETDTRLVYESDTLPGASGSVVIGLGTCEVIALHHAGLPRTDAQNNVLTKAGGIAGPGTLDEEIDWIGNEGIKISCIMTALRQAKLSPGMDGLRQKLLQNTASRAQELKGRSLDPPHPPQPVESPADTTSIPQNNQAMNNSTVASGTANFLIAAINAPPVVAGLEMALKARYGTGVSLQLAMPFSAVGGELELFSIGIPEVQDPVQELKELLALPGVNYAEVDGPLALNAGTGFAKAASGIPATESNALGLVDDGYATPNEAAFLTRYIDGGKVSVYISRQDTAKTRAWNQYATNFDKLFADPGKPSPRKQGIRVVQFDTGYSDHPKVLGGFDTDNDSNFLDGEKETDARDAAGTGVLRQPGHGTRTGSLLIGNKDLPLESNGNSGLLSGDGYKLAPYRISQSVILIDRQKQLARALDSAIARGFDVITMSMGLPPTMSTAKMAKKAYDAGVIWCCAAGNEVQAVIAPAVYPGTIAVAASNPWDADWPASSRGGAVDITAPGEDVYVPVLIREGNVVKDGFAYGDGTSYATPHVAAAAAYWLAKYKTELNAKEFAGWRRVEAFRQALVASARDSDKLPSKGFGAGILDFQKLLTVTPAWLLQNGRIEYAYNGWNEHAFFASIQGYGEMTKTYWNRLHGKLFGTKRGAQESLFAGAAPLSDTSRRLEEAMFGAGSGVYESAGSVSEETARERFNVLHQIITSTANQ